MHRTLLLVALAMFALVIVACAPAAAPTAAPTAAPKQAAATPTAGTGGVVVQALGREYLAYPKTKGTIRFSNCWGGARVPLIEAWMKEFNATYPDIQIVNDTQDCSKIMQTQVTQIAGGDAPEAMMILSGNYPFFVKQDSLMPLDDWIKRDKVDPAWFYDAEWKARQVDGKVYGLPNVTAGAQHLLFYNTALLEKLGWDSKKVPETWQDLDSLVEPAKKAGLFVLDPAKMPTGQTSFGALLYANGGKYWSDDLKKITWNSPEGVEAAEWMLKFVKAQAGKYENLAAAGNRKDVIQPTTWGAEKYATAFNGSWFIFQLQQQAPNVKFGLTAFPRNAKNANSKGFTFVEGGWGFAIPKSAKDKEAAWEWIKFTTASKAACDFVAAQNRPSPVKACNQDPRLKNSSPQWDKVQQVLNTGIIVPLTDKHPEFQQMLFDLEDAILYEKMAPKEALDKSAAQAQQLLDEWNKTRK